MKKRNLFLQFPLFILLLELSAVLALCTRSSFIVSVYPFRNISLLLVTFGGCGFLCLFFLKGRLKSALSRLLRICNTVLSGILLIFFAALLLLRLFPDNDAFSTSTTLFQNKNVMIVIPHQDDDINLAGGLIEQYTAAGSDVTVVFSTNGDRHGEAEIRAVETVKVLTDLGVKQENIYYLGFGDQWAAQVWRSAEISHIYNSPDPDALWTSLSGKTATCSTSSIPCYQDLPYTRSSYVFSLQTIIEEKQPDTIFAVDFDDHIDHKGTDLFFEEALCNVLTEQPDYHPTVYKGFCYGTAWLGADDYGSSLNLLSSVQPDSTTWSAAAYGYNWDARVRFPMSRTNLNRFLVNNSVFDSLNQYHSQRAVLQATRILNGDKVFWERRTDSLLYGAEIYAAGLETHLLNDFKLKDFADIGAVSGKNTGVVPLYGGNVTIETGTPVHVSCLYLYDNPDLYANILEGFITFSDGSQIPFGPLNKDGSATVLSFPERQITGMEIVVTGTDSDRAGFTEIEAYHTAPALPESSETFLMATDSDDNFLYDHILQGSDTVTLSVGRYPERTTLSSKDLSMTFTGKGTDCRWEEDALVVTCPKGKTCTVTLSDGITETAFTVSHPGRMEYAYLQSLRFIESMTLNFRSLLFITTDYIKAFLPTP